MNKIIFENDLINVPTWDFEANTSIYPNSSIILNKVIKTYKLSEIEEMILGPRNYFYILAKDNHDDVLAKELDSFFIAENGVQRIKRRILKYFFWGAEQLIAEIGIDPFKALLIKLKTGKHILLPIYYYEPETSRQMVAALNNSGVPIELILRQDLDPVTYPVYEDNLIMRLIERKAYLYLSIIVAVIIYFVVVLVKNALNSL